jgi:hypothetical protein
MWQFDSMTQYTAAVMQQTFLQVKCQGVTPEVVLRLTLQCALV